MDIIAIICSLGNLCLWASLPVVAHSWENSSGWNSDLQLSAQVSNPLGERTGWGAGFRGWEVSVYRHLTWPDLPRSPLQSEGEFLGQYLTTCCLPPGIGQGLTAPWLLPCPAYRDFLLSAKKINPFSKLPTRQADEDMMKPFSTTPRSTQRGQDSFPDKNILLLCIFCYCPGNGVGTSHVSEAETRS